MIEFSLDTKQVTYVGIRTYAWNLDGQGIYNLITICTRCARNGKKVTSFANQTLSYLSLNILDYPIGQVGRARREDEGRRKSHVRAPDCSLRLIHYSPLCNFSAHDFAIYRKMEPYISSSLSTPVYNTSKSPWALLFATWQMFNQLTVEERGGRDREAGLKTFSNWTRADRTIIEFM